MINIHKNIPPAPFKGGEYPAIFKIYAAFLKLSCNVYVLRPTSLGLISYVRQTKQYIMLQKADITISTNNENKAQKIKALAASLAKIGLIVLCFMPIFMPNTAKFLPRYFSDTFYTALLILGFGGLVVAIYTIIAKRVVKITLLDVAFGLFILYAFSRFAFHPLAHWSQGRFVWWLALFGMYLVFRLGLPLVKYSHISIALFLLALAQISIGQLQLLDILPSEHSLFKITGTFFNPAPFSGFLAIIFPLALFEGLKKEETALKYLAWLVVAGTLLVIIPAQSRAAWLALAAGAMVVITTRFNLFSYLGQWSKSKLIALSLFTLLLVGLGAYALYHFKADSASGRLLIWKVSARMWQENPLFGNGFTRFAPEYMLAQADYFATGQGSPKEELLAGNTPFAYNEFIQIAVELGLLGLLLFLAIFFIALFKAHPIKQTPLNHHSAIKAMLLAWIVFACFSYPFDVWGTSVLLFFVVAWLSKVAPALWEGKTRFFNAGFKMGMLLPVLFAFYWVGHTYVARDYWKEGYEAYQTWQYKKAKKQYSLAFDKLQYEGIYLQHLGKNLALLGQYKESSDLLQLAKNYYNDPVLYTTLGDNYKQLQVYNKAETALVNARNMIPHRIYPAYLLAQTYYASQQRQKAAELATSLLAKDIKVRSLATDEILNQLKILSAIEY